MTADLCIQSAMCLNLPTYAAPLKQVAALLGARTAWLEDKVANGIVLLAGRRTPRTGRIMAVCGSAEEVAATAVRAPFIVGDVATKKFERFTANFANPAIDDLLK